MRSNGKPKENSTSKALLYPLISEPSALARENRKRRAAFDFASIGYSRLHEFLQDGWEHDRDLKRRVRVKRRKTPAERLENRFWTLLYKLGYPELNRGREFRILVQKRGGEPLEKRVNVFAKDVETVIVSVCKSSAKIARRSLQKDMTEFASLKGPMATAVKKHYGTAFKPKILWLFVTDNIVWSESDKKRAQKHRICRITEKELRYFSQIADHLGPAARYQFLAEYLAGLKIPALADRFVPAIRGRLGGRKFYSFVITPDHLLKIAFINHRSLNDPQGIPTYQRLVSRGRIRRIGSFLRGGGFFPTNFLVNFPQKVRFDIVQRDEEAEVTYGYLYLPDRYKAAWIIDGQHRLYGYSRLDAKYLRQNIVVIAFEQMSIEDEANLFVTINHEQKSVPRNLLDDLEGDLKWGSKIPTERIGSIAARLIQVLNDDIGEPFYGRVTAQGIRATPHTCLTVPQVKDGLKKSGLLGRATMRKRMYEPGPLAGQTDLDTLERARSCLNLFFRQIQETNFDLWEKGREGHVCTNVGVQGYLLLLAAIIEEIVEKAEVNPRSLGTGELVLKVQPYLSGVTSTLDNLEPTKAQRLFRVPYGAGGPPEYFYRLCRLVRQAVPEFSPEGYLDWEDAQSEERIQKAEAQLKEINIKVQELIFSTFKRMYGLDQYFEKGVRNVDMRVAAFRRQQDNPPERRLPLENYLEFLDYMKLISAKEHWPHFKNVLNIPERGDKGKAKNLKWMERVNELRRIPAHATRQRQFQVEDFEYLDWIHRELESRFQREKSKASGQEQN